MEWVSFIAIIISLVIIGFLAGLESAFISSNKLSIELARKQGKYAGKTWSHFADNPTRFMGTLLLGYSVMLVLYGLLIGDLLSPVWNWIEPKLPPSAEAYLKYIRLLVESVLALSIILFVEVLSRAIFRSSHHAILQNGIISYMANFFYWLLSSLSAVFVNASEWMLKYVFNVRLSKRKEVFSKVDLEQFIQQLRSGDDEDVSELNKELFENALSLSEVKLRECLIPRKEIVSMDVRSTIEEARQKFIQTKLTRLIVYDQSIDNVVGYIHQLDLFGHPARIQDILHPIPMVPESMSATDLMNKFNRERRSIAWVVDEFGGTSGIVTMEDLLEEIFGDIQDEYDVGETLIERKLSDTEYLFSGRLKLDYIEEKYGMKFPEHNNEAETLSGYIVQYNESIPKQRGRIIAGKYEFEIITMSGTRIETVKLKVLR